MTSTVTMPLWLLIVILAFAAVTFASHFLFPSVRWFFRRRMEKVVARLNERLERPIQPFKLARRHDMIQRLIYDPEVSKAIIEHARQEGVPENVAFQTARSYAREIVPSFSASLYFGLAIKLAKLISTSLYRVRLGHHAEDHLKAIDPDATVVFVMNHRSNMDYVLVTYLAAERSALSYAVGEWAQVWPLSRLIKAMGAYFIRRKSRNALYRKVLARYVRLATEGGVMQAVFPEGGLSLDGALAEPKLGILKYIVEGHDVSLRDVVFVPVAINYDRVFEDRILVTAGQTGERRFRARISVILRFLFKQIWLRLRGKYHRFGYAAVSFGPPVHLHRLLEEESEDTMSKLAAQLMRRIGEEVPVLPVPLVASALLAASGPLDRAALEECVHRLLAQLPDAHLHLPRNDLGYAVEVGLRNLIGRALVNEKEGRFSVAQDGRPLIAFYAASIEHLFEKPL
ncbi:1-acyl-sn-glycerol-3-phosphate acyltransferase [Aquicoccus porphyridii]|uniref:Glycerol-3-phosphate acyltransferase n=1 Tax=Aquicoccus porphyridii TaxID=1852029 RepID=A0A5A9Z5J8_9RHOB|nr:1-acyl-sn-glycerol-3-phosphate acyltransferase [Aquicoccus porphyridii]KAA0912473.1 glycerol-3-phosphate acyltransferase [Aquicoccus porphyridii]RAI53153.1 glycerol-3-phosphate acyltransferase [Rhodobacteraceae bacterium AsT-22]